MLADLRLLLVGFITSIAATVVWTTSVGLSMGLAPVLVGIALFAISTRVWRAVADLDRANAAVWLGRPIHGNYRPIPQGGFWERIGAAFADPQCWRDLVWLFVHGILGFAFGTIALSGIAAVGGALVAPAWWWSLPETDWDVSPWVAVALSVPLAGLLVALMRGMAWAEAHMAAALLGGGTQASAAQGPGSAQIPYDAELWLSRHASGAALIGFLNTLIWGLTGAGYFWPIWVWLGLAITLGLHASAAGRITKAQSLTAIGALCVLIWALTGAGYFWPVWPLLGMGVAYVVPRLWTRRNLEERVDTLERTRSGALDVQAAELRRIERDLHDGAQARLVALTMQLGRAEERLADNPEAAELVRQSRLEAGAAIAELRDLARGIAPPVLADRGLAAAVEALANRAAIPATADIALDRRLPAVVETAAYFVVAEALTNVAKHARGATAHVDARVVDERLVVEVRDDGSGGADPNGGGLTGLRHRVEALDGTLKVQTGDGTTIRAEIPCG